MLVAQLTPPTKIVYFIKIQRNRKGATGKSYAFKNLENTTRSGRTLLQGLRCGLNLLFWGHFSGLRKAVYQKGAEQIGEVFKGASRF